MPAAHARSHCCQQNNPRMWDWSLKITKKSHKSSTTTQGTSYSSVVVAWHHLTSCLVLPLRRNFSNSTDAIHLEAQLIRQLIRWPCRCAARAAIGLMRYMSRVRTSTVWAKFSTCMSKQLCLLEDIYGHGLYQRNQLICENFCFQGKVAIATSTSASRQPRMRKPEMDDCITCYDGLQTWSRLSYE